jgi:glycine cleavage system H lipoate-binding protein
MKTLRTTALLIAAICLLLSPTFAAQPADRNLNQLSIELTSAYAAQHQGSNLSFVSIDQMDDSNPFAIMYGPTARALNTPPATQLLVGRDAAVVVIQSNQPDYEQWIKKGITFQELAALVRSQPQEVLFSSRQLVDIMQAYLGLTLDVNTLNISNQPFVQHISVSKSTFGVCMLSEVLLSNHQLVQGIALLPFDKNENGSIDSPEAFYDNPQTFARALWLGKYPKMLTQNIIMVSSKSELNAQEKELVSWLLSSGQQTLSANGFVALNPHELMAELKKLDPAPIQHEGLPQENQNAWIVILLIFTGGFVAFGALLLWIFKDRSPLVETPNEPTKSSFDLDALKAPKGLMYDKGHLWAFMENNGKVKIGMDDFLGHIFGNATHFDTLAVGTQLVKGEELITLTHEGKQIKLTSPVAGKIVEVNNEFSSFNSNTVDNWMYKIEPLNWQREAGFMLMYEEYSTWLKTEFNRFKDFLAIAMNTHSPQQAWITLQDGGTLYDGLMTEMTPEIWEDFQNQFLKANQ